jgi:hypothetical protein
MIERHRWRAITLLIPCCRQIASVFIAASACFKTPMICSSVKRRCLISCPPSGFYTLGELSFTTEALLSQPLLAFAQDLRRTGCSHAGHAQGAN